MLRSHASYPAFQIANINCTARVKIWDKNFWEKPTFKQRSGGSLGYWVSFSKIHSILVLQLATLQQVDSVEIAWNVWVWEVFSVCIFFFPSHFLNFSTVEFCGFFSPMSNIYNSVPFLHKTYCGMERTRSYFWYLYLQWFLIMSTRCTHVLKFL